VTPEVLNFLLQAGLPAGLGVLVVYYLLQHHLPREQAMYSESLRAQQDTFKDALTSEQKVHGELMTQLTEQHKESLSVLRDTFVDEHNRTRVALDRLSEQTSKLSEAVFTLRGQEGQGGN
jgi:hypothetical protein